MVTIVNNKDLILGTVAHVGDVGDLYDATLDGKNILVKVPRSEHDNDLVANESRVLQRLTDGNKMAPGTVPAIEEIERIKYAAYMPTPVELNALGTGSSGESLALSGTEVLDGMYPLSQIVADIGLLDAKDAAWIWRRLLVALGFVHSQGYVHCAIHPEHIMIEPAKHGLVLIDWCYSRKIGDPAVAYVSKHHDIIPKEILRKAGLSPATDITMATRAMLSVTDPGTLPGLIRGFAQACTNGLSDAWQAKERFDYLIEREWGARKFRPMNYPKTNA